MTDNVTNRKIVTLLTAPRDGTTEQTPLLSLEYFPPRSTDGVVNLKTRMDRLHSTIQPVFCDVTWGAGGSTSELSMDLAAYIAKNSSNLQPMANLHLTCTNMMHAADPHAELKSVLNTALSHGIYNIVALRGDAPVGMDESNLQTHDDFTCALDLVRFIRTEFGDTFGISVAGYPEGHPVAISAVDTNGVATLTPTERARCSTDLETGQVYVCRDADYAKELAYLKQKVDAGADFIITQMFFDTSVYIQFVSDCRAVGIAVPIVPGLMCLTGRAGFYKMARFCKTRVPDALTELMTGVTSDTDTTEDDQVKAIGVTWGTQQCRDIMDMPDGTAPPVLHFYTLNLEKVVTGILTELGRIANA